LNYITLLDAEKMASSALQVNQDQEDDVQQDQEGDVQQDQEDDDVKHNEYLGEVLGSDVVIRLEVDDSPGKFRPFLGIVREMKADLYDDGLDVQHCVWFQNGDKLWFDLANLEEQKLLTWIPHVITSNVTGTSAVNSQVFAVNRTSSTTTPEESSSASSSSMSEETDSDEDSDSDSDSDSDTDIEDSDSDTDIEDSDSDSDDYSDTDSDDSDYTHPAKRQRTNNMTPLLIRLARARTSSNSNSTSWKGLVFTE